MLMEPHKVLALKLFVLAAKEKKTDVEAKTQISYLYQELWPTKFTDRNELDDRSAIDDFLDGST